MQLKFSGLVFFFSLVLTHGLEQLITYLLN